jgi:hydrogenase nickel incorporation protein HypB
VTRQPVSVNKRVLESNDQIAEANRRLFERCGLVALNFIASPGAGKTTLLMATIRAMREKVRFVVIEGDLATSQDAEKIASVGVPVRQINTNGACHLSARQVADAVAQMPVDRCDLLLIENVGNLVCPAAFDLGEQAKVALLSMPEGDDKPSKYPSIFAKAAAVVVTKADLAGHVDFDLERVRRDIARLNPTCQVIVTSARTGEGLDAWYAWLGGRCVRGGGSGAGTGPGA